MLNTKSLVSPLFKQILCFTKVVVVFIVLATAKLYAVNLSENSSGEIPASSSLSLSKEHLRCVRSLQATLPIELSVSPISASPISASPVGVSPVGVGPIGIGPISVSAAGVSSGSTSLPQVSVPGVAVAAASPDITATQLAELSLQTETVIRQLASLNRSKGNQQDHPLTSQHNHTSEIREAIVRSLLLQKRLELEEKYGVGIANKILREVQRRLNQDPISSSPQETKPKISSDQNHRIEGVQILNPRPVMEMEGHKTFIRSVAWSDDGKRIVTASMDRTAKIWSVKTGRLLVLFDGHSNSLNSAVFSHNGHKVISSSSGKSAKIWWADDGELVDDLAGHTESLVAAFFSTKDDFVVTASDDHRVIIWNAQTGKVIRELPPLENGIEAIALSPNDQRLAITPFKSKTIYLYDLSGLHSHREIKPLELHGHRSNVTALGFSPNSEQLISFAGRPGKHVKGIAKIWNLNSGHPLSEFQIPMINLQSVAFSPNHDLVLLMSTDRKNGPLLVDWIQRKVIYDFSGKTPAIQGGTFGPDGKHLALIRSDNKVQIWSLYDQFHPEH